MVGAGETTVSDIRVTLEVKLPQGVGGPFLVIQRGHRKRNLVRQEV